MKRRDLESIVDAMDEYCGRGFYASIRAVQVRQELLEFAALLQEARPRVIIEIGTYKGGTLYVWSRSNPTAELIVSIDLPGGRYGGGYERRRQRLYREFLFDRPGAAMRLLQSDSHDPATLEQLKAILGARRADFLYIDGDHTYDGVRLDYEMYSPLVREGGVIAFHDIATRKADAGVYRLWDELKRGRRWREFVQPRSNKGIGVVWAE
jgi:cephalosporin hydroxylase